MIRDWIESGHANTDSLEALDSCIQCVGCESACPSGVQYGHLISATREAMNSTPARVPLVVRLLLHVLKFPRILLVSSSVLAVAQRLRVVPRSFGIPWLTLRRPRLDVALVDVSVDDGQHPGIDSNNAWFFRGCVMDSWMRDVHVDTVNVMKTADVDVMQPKRATMCCGALHHHAGLSEQARAMARHVVQAFPGDAPIVVNSAGCGAMLKEYGHLIGTAEAHAFSKRVVDVHEFLARPSRLSLLSERVGTRSARLVVVQDPCHLRHAQRSHLPVRQLLELVADTVDIPDDGLCCGAGGSYFLTHREMAIDLRDRKISLIRSVTKGKDQFVVASANPGCSMHIANGGMEVLHPMTLMARHLNVAKETPLP